MLYLAQCYVLQERTWNLLTVALVVTMLGKLIHF